MMRMQTWAMRPCYTAVTPRGSACLCLLLHLCFLSLNAFSQATENEPKFLSHSEIIQRWKDLPLDDTTAAAEKGDLTAQHYLGYFNFEGLGGVTNRVEGLKWYRLAAAAGFPNAINNLGVAYSKGLEVEKDVAKAEEYFRESARKGFPTAQRNLAEILLKKKDVVAHRDEARRLLEKAARAGDTTAQMRLGAILLDPPGGGYIETQNALYMYKKAYENGRLEAISAIGNVYMESHSIKDYALALRWHRLGVEKEQPSSETALGWMYFNGFGVSVDKEKAYELTSRAAGRNYSPAVVNMGRYYSGDQMPNLPDDFQPDLPKAIEWYTKAVDLGNSRAQYYLGRLIWEGKVPGRNRDEARPLLEKAQDQNQSGAWSMICLIDMESALGTPQEASVVERLAFKYFDPAILKLAQKYHTGDHFPKDYVRAVLLYLRAQSRNSYEAYQALDVLGPAERPKAGLSKEKAEFAAVVSAMTIALKKKETTYFREQGVRYIQGEGVPKDDISASVWLKLAAEEGDAEARKQAEEIESRLSDQQKSAAKVWLEWLKNNRWNGLRTDQ